ncbi:MAG: putative pyruvate dehydrogenase E1 component, beta subunit [Candidatus Xenolissoclinum pacificiensis L6]|uniref:Pyruvate dehydrogenase E1 component subunit beta n=1 Tax=Candidatus Xenolissoclinum pacificiensis L6 TaxID=1401685 RepID=W2V056_9RICK|nr:MAG: putative pyruvate dehydrogenase E1 component, beta subunit [Candidatus Xenolissoclinum pacificiensis L6]
MKVITVREALNQALREELMFDDRVFIAGEEVAEYQGAYKITQELLKEFGKKRVIDTPISEYGFSGLAVGAAYDGLRPIIEFMSFNFSMQAIDHIINSAAKTLYMSGGTISTPIVFRGPNSIAAQVAAQHSQCYASWYAHIPGLKVIAPYSASDFKSLLKASVRDNNPVVFLEHELLYGQTHEITDAEWSSEYIGEIGKAQVVIQGTDLTLISFSHMMIPTLQTHSILKEKHGINAEVIDLRTIRPLDVDSIVNSVRKTHNVVIIEEGWGFCGVASEVISTIIEQAFDDLDSPPSRVTALDVPMPYAKNLETLVNPTTDKIVTTVEKLFNI